MSDQRRGDARAVIRWSALALGALLAGCSTYEFSRPVAFTCELDQRCPAGFQCVSEVCVREGAPTPPLLLVRSGSPFRVHAASDVDRNAVVNCWTTEEDLGVVDGGVHASFVTADGTVRPSIRLASFDTRERRFLASCAPIPNSGGKILVAAWRQRSDAASAAVGRASDNTAVTTLDLMVWEPDQPNGFTGRARPYYSETSPDLLFTPNQSIELDIVGDQVWVPVMWSLGAPDAAYRMANPVFGSLEGSFIGPSVLRIGSNELTTGRPERINYEPTRPMFVDTSVWARASATEGLWLMIGYQISIVGLATPTSGIFIGGPADGRNLFSVQRPLVGHRVMYQGRPVEQLAMLWPEHEDVGSVNRFRVAWRLPASRAGLRGPMLPFHRADTPDPGAVVVGDDLYIAGAVMGTPVPPAPPDAGPPSADASAGAGPAGDAGVEVGPLNIYRTPWGAPDHGAFTTAATITARVAPSQVVATAMARVPRESRTVVLSWIEFYPPDGVRNGARYALYSQRVVLP